MLMSLETNSLMSMDSVMTKRSMMVTSLLSYSERGLKTVNSK
jgi:hypothetical protein